MCYNHGTENEKSSTELADIIELKTDKQKRYEEIVKRMDQLGEILGYSRDEDGNSLRKKALRDESATQLLIKIEERHPDELDEYHRLSYERGKLEDELGISDELEKVFEEAMLSLGINPDEKEPGPTLEK